MAPTYNHAVQPRYHLLTAEDISYIHEQALKILSDIGMRISHEEGLRLLINNGCVLKESDIVTFPRELIEKCLKTVPSEIIVYNRLGKEAMRLGGRNNYFGTGTDLIKTVDLHTQEIRPTTLQDVINTAKVMDYCDQVDFAGTFGLPSDIHKNLTYIENVKALLENTTKPIFFTAGGKEDLEYIFQMASVVAGSREKLQEKPFLIHYSEPTAPLTHSYGGIQKLFHCADNRIPICYVPGDIMGASCPVTLAGGVVQGIAEALSGIVLHQLRNPGAPIISGFAVVPLDMKTAVFCYGAPDWRLTNSAFADMMHYYNIPKWSTVGSDAIIMDQQAGFEHGMATLMVALDGANLIHDIGYLGQGLVANPVSIVMSDEIVSYVRRILRGFTLNDNKVGFETIAKVGPSGSFLNQRHTLKNFREETWRPTNLNRVNPDVWVAEGQKSYGEILQRKTLDIITRHVPQPLSQAVQQQINSILEDAYITLDSFKFRA